MGDKGWTIDSADYAPLHRVTPAERAEAIGLANTLAEGSGEWDREPTDDDYSENGPDGIVYSHTVPCGLCGEVHPC
jgi:hypothetical protein